MQIMHTFFTFSVFEHKKHILYLYGHKQQPIKRMKQHVLSGIGLLFLSLFIFTACTKSKDSSDAELSYKVEPSNLTSSVGTTVSESGLIVTLNSNSSLTWKAGFITIETLSFEAKKESSEIEYKLKKSPTVDLFKQTQMLGSINLPAATYNEVELKVVLQKQTTGDVFAINGVYTDETGKQTPLDFHYNEDLILHLEAENLTVNTAADYTGVLILELNKLLSGVSATDFKAASKNANGVIVISSTSNVEVFNKMKSNLASLAKAEFE